jgi:hypothetical protein
MLEGNNNFSGLGFRLMFSPLSKIMSIHCFSLSPFGLQDLRKPQGECNNYSEQLTERATEESNPMCHNNSVFLNRIKHRMEAVRDFD